MRGRSLVQLKGHDNLAWLYTRVFVEEPARVWFESFDPPEDRNPMGPYEFGL